MEHRTQVHLVQRAPPGARVILTTPAGVHRHLELGRFVVTAASPSTIKSAGVAPRHITPEQQGVGYQIQA